MQARLRTIGVSENGMAHKAIPFLAYLAACVLSLSACGRPPVPPLESLFIDKTEQGLSPKTMSGILLTQSQLLAKPDDAKLPFALSFAYLQGLRENADTQFYDRIEGLMQRVLQTDPTNPEVPFLRGTVAAGRHDFHTAENYARQVTTQHPEVARYYGLLTDALVETGQYDAAVQALQSMSDLRPDYAALTRIAYLREIHGDVAGAMEAMDNALQAQTGVPENTAWAYSEYARLLLPSDPAKAQILYARALEAYPNFPAALVGEAKVAMTHGDAAGAEKLFEHVMDILPLPDYAAQLGDVYAYDKQSAKAAAQFALVQAGYDQIAAGGTNVALERTKFLLDHDLNMDTIVDRARAVYADRPTIYAADTLAYALYKTKALAEAGDFSAKALATGSHDPMILFHAGLIEKALGKKAEAKAHLQMLLKESPFFSFRWKPVAQEALKGL